MSDPVISMEDVEVHFEKDQGLLESFLEEPDTVGAVDGVSLEIPENDVVALVGESGCGKTTLGKAAIGAQRPTGGSVKYRGHDVWKANDGDVDYPFEDIRRSLQIIHQDPGGALNPNKTVMRCLTAPLKRWNPEMSTEDRRARVLRMLERVGMEPPQDYASRFPHQLSGGEQQRVALVRALLMNPDLILADEAVSALDVSLRVEVMDLMLELQEQFDTSFLFISHNLSNARYLAEKAGGRIGIMYLGELVEIGPADEVLNDPEHPYTQILRWATADLDPDPEIEEPPIRDIDIPDPVDPPSGCRFHTRCPKAREACKRQTPELNVARTSGAGDAGEAVADGGRSGTDDSRDAGGRDGDRRSHAASCFRTDPDHEYWDSDPLPGAEDEGSDNA